jgi:hypothetical protein
MPTPTITHKSWCQEHQTDYEGEFCFAGFSWGPKRPDDGSLNGDVWASQQVATFGDSELDDQPTVAIELGARSIELRVEDLLSLRKAVDGLLQTFGVEVIA